jgi:hypothetical protein
MPKTSSYMISSRTIPSEGSFSAHVVPMYTLDRLFRAWCCASVRCPCRCQSLLAIRRTESGYYLGRSPVSPIPYGDNALGEVEGSSKSYPRYLCHNLGTTARCSERAIHVPRNSKQTCVSLHAASAIGDQAENKPRARLALPDTTTVISQPLRSTNMNCCAFSGLRLDCSGPHGLPTSDLRLATLVRR